MRVNFESCGIFSSLVSYRKLICLARLCSPGSEHTCLDQFCSAASAMLLLRFVREHWVGDAFTRRVARIRHSTSSR